MLSEKHNEVLRWFVYGGVLDEWLNDWEKGETMNLYRRTQVTRGLAENDREKGKLLAAQFCNVFLKIVCSKFKDRETWTSQEWVINMRNDTEIKKEFHEYLDRIAICGIDDIRGACDFVISCVDKNTDGNYIFNSDRYDTQTKERKEKRRMQDEEHTKQRLARENAEAHAWAERRMAELRRDYPIEQYQRQKETTAQEKKEPDLEDLIATCTDGLDVVTGDDDLFNMFRVMNGFKQEALRLLQGPINLASNHQFLKLIEDTYRNVMQAVSRASIAEDDSRVQLAKARITQVNNALQKQRQELEQQRDATPATAAPSEAKAETEEKATAKRPFSLLKPWTWRRDRTEPSHEHIRQLLSRMQELNSCTSD